jgi:hypothetical protein
VAVEARDLSRGRLRVRNKQDFEGLSWLRGRFELSVDGAVVQRGRLPRLASGPGESADVTLALERPALLPRQECHLTLRFETARDLPWARRGTEVAWEQFAMPWRSRPRAARASAAAGRAALLAVEESGANVRIAGDGLRALFDREAGRLVALDTPAGALLAAPPRLVLWRAPTDNDRGGPALAREPGAVRFVDLGLEGLVSSEVETRLRRGRDGDVAVVVRERLRVPKAEAEVLHQHVYAVRREGEIVIANEVRVPSALGDLARVGIVFAAAPGLELLTWFGRGPHESYADRKAGAALGRYTGSVDDQYVAYIRPQAHGNKTDVRWFTLVREDGAAPALLVAGARPFEFSVSHFADEDLSRARHTTDLVRRDEVIVHVDAAQRGVGTGACGPDTLAAYRVGPGTHRFALSLHPFDPRREDPARLARAHAAPRPKARPKTPPAARPRRRGTLARASVGALLWLLALGLLMTASPGCRREPPPPEPPASALGALHVAAYGDAALRGTRGESLRHTSEWVNGPHYQGMEDVDLRGFLDGRFIYGWNQPTQIHLRLGRRDTRPRWGETELFRSIQRWADVKLAPGARVHRAELEIYVEKAPKRPLDLMLYRLHKDFDPGRGGVLGDGTSPPRPGEVWWGARAHEQEPWGHPGVGFASQTHPDADTPNVPLAEARFERGDEPEVGKRIVFASEALARYVEERATQGLPLLFLLKLSDALEDTPGTQFFFFSGNHGDLRNTARRPLLRVTWEAPGQVARLAEPVHLEHGRVLGFPRMEAPAARLVAASFEAAAGHESPTVEVRGGRGDAVSAWRPAALPFDAPWDWLEVRVLAARDPLVLGQAFESGLRDTWMLTAPPEEQRVPFVFTSPQGERHEVLARYEGDFAWSVSFLPTELGRWRYAWKQDFLKHTFRSPKGVFDVVTGDRQNLERQLRALLERARAEGLPRDREYTELAPAFWKLERAIFQLETPESLASEEGRVLRELVVEIREALSGREVPAEVRATPYEREY